MKTTVFNLLLLSLAILFYGCADSETKGEGVSAPTPAEGPYRPNGPSCHIVKWDGRSHECSEGPMEKRRCESALKMAEAQHKRDAFEITFSEERGCPTDFGFYGCCKGPSTTECHYASGIYSPEKNAKIMADVRQRCIDFGMTWEPKR
jgi:hypothetical protein